MFYYDSWNILQGKVQGVTGQKCFYRAKLIWPPMFSYDSWKMRFSQIIVFLRVNFKISKIYRAKLKKISANTKLFFWNFTNCNWNECVFVIFWKCGHFSLTDTRCFIMPNCMKNHIFCQFVWGDTQVHFQISINVLYETIFNLHSFIKT